MDFTYQVNGDIQFNTNHALLKIAEDNKPELFHRSIAPTRLVDLTDDPDKLGGIGVKSSEINIEKLSVVSYPAVAAWPAGNTKRERQSIRSLAACAATARDFRACLKVQKRF